MTACACDPSGGVETAGFLGLATEPVGLAESVSSRFSERPHLTKIRWLKTEKVTHGYEHVLLLQGTGVKFLVSMSESSQHI